MPQPGQPAPTRTYSEDAIAQALALLYAGKTYREIEASTGVPAGSVTYYLRKHLKDNPAAEPPPRRRAPRSADHLETELMKRDELIAELRARVEYLERQLETANAVSAALAGAAQK